MGVLPRVRGTAFALFAKQTCSAQPRQPGDAPLPTPFRQAYAFGRGPEWRQLMADVPARRRPLVWLTATLALLSFSAGVPASAQNAKTQAQDREIDLALALAID